jgi:hypothetical protein
MNQRLNSPTASRPLLSILIPTKNRAYYLRYAIQSAINIDSDDIEIIVSENHGSDNGWQVANSFLDPRLKVLRPKMPLPMHENFELLLKEASGRWITFIGDDDAVMPHCVDYLRYLDSKYPEAEAIVSPRAYYFWNAAYAPMDQPRCSFSIRHIEMWRDSKESLSKCLAGSIDYIFLPQMYSGGFHRRSLVQRVLRMQGGTYFRSVTPDAYSAVMAVLHTYRYVEVGVPMTWVGTSPQSSYGGAIVTAKNRADDFIGMHSEDTLEMNPCLGTEFASWPFLMHFFEAYLCAVPFVDCSVLSSRYIARIYKLCAIKLILRGDVNGSIALARSLGVTPLRPDRVVQQAKRERLIQRLIQIREWPFKISKYVSRLFVSWFFSSSSASPAPFAFEYEAEGRECPDILAIDSVLEQAFSAYYCTHIIEG